MNVKRSTLALAGLTLLVLVLSIPGAWRDAFDRGGIYLFSHAFLDDLPKRLMGPGRSRFVLQPLVAILLGIRSGVADARTGRRPYLLGLVTDRQHRGQLARDGLATVANLLLMGVLLDAIFQWVILGVSHPGAALVVGPVLIAAPYAVARALSNRAARLSARSVLVLGATLAAALACHASEAQLLAQEPVLKGRPFGEWRQDLQSGTPSVRERAVAALCELGEPAVPLLVGAIGDLDFNVRTLAIFCLGRLGPRAKDAIPALVRTLEDRDGIVRRYAAGALGLLEETASEAAPALARTAVEDSSREVRQTATLALGRLGPAARERTRPILQQLSTAGADEAVRARAAELLRDMEKR